MMIQKVMDFCEIPGRCRFLCFSGRTALHAEACKNGSQILVHQKKFFCIRSFRNVKKKLDAADHRRGKGKGKTQAAFFRIGEKEESVVPLIKNSLKFQGSTTDCREKF